MDLLQEYATNDLYLASYLKARGLHLVDVEKDGRRSRFIFHDRPDRGQMVADFYNDVAIGVNAFTHALQDLKAAIHNWDGTPPTREAGLR